MSKYGFFTGLCFIALFVPFAVISERIAISLYILGMLLCIIFAIIMCFQ